MKIRITTPLANRRRGEVANLDDGSATLLIAQGNAEPVNEDQDDEPAPPSADPASAPSARRRSRTRPTTDHTP